MSVQVNNEGADISIGKVTCSALASICTAPAQLPSNESVSIIELSIAEDILTAALA